MAAPLAQHKPLALRATRLSTATVGRFERLTLTLELEATYDNPFDPNDIDVHADFLSPQGATVRVNGFLDRPFTRRLDSGQERVEAAGPPVWRIRFTPDRVGSWQYRVSARDQTGTAALPLARFTVRPSAQPGFIRRSAHNPLTFSYDSGRPFFAIGENMGWGNGPGTFSYDQWLPPLHAAGGNWIRVWMGPPGNCPLEWPDADTSDGHETGLGVYNLASAWKLDAILDAADKNGVSVMVCLGTFGELTEGGFFHEGQWPRNPYNAANGGPCAKSSDMWTNATARKFYRQRLRYLAARYGCRTNLQSWEFWNEVNAPASWVGEMAHYLKATADPYKHLITTSYGDEAVWRVPEIDFTQTHLYGTGDIPDHAPPVHNDARKLTALGKPHLMAEFGIDYRAPDAKYAPEGLGVNLHNGIWAAALSGNAGSAMLWWWDNYVEPKHLYPRFQGLSRFMAGVNLGSGPWSPLKADAPIVKSGPETFGDLTLPAGTGWGKAPTSDFTLPPEGMTERPTLPSYLYSPGKADLRTTPTFHVRFARPGRFVVHVDSVSDSARLRFLLDGRVAREQAFSAAPPADPSVTPDYKTTQLRPEYKNYEAHYDRDYDIPVPAGAHTLTLDNAGGDWLSVTSYTLTGYRSSRFPDVNLYGLTRGRTALLWAQNAAHTWKNALDKMPIPPVRSAKTAIHGLPPGRYRVEWWDTERGVVTRRQSAVCAGGALPLTLPDLPTDVAARITPAAP